MNLRTVDELATRYGLDVVVVPVDRKRGDHVPKGAAVAVSRTVRGVGTEYVAHYRTTRAGYLKPHDGYAEDPEHVTLLAAASEAWGLGRRGAYAAVEREVQRGEVEVLSRQPGLGGGHLGVGGDPDAQIVEYVVHPSARR